MNKKILKIGVIVVFTFALVANLQYALFNYGIKDNRASQQLFAQGAGGTTTGGGGTGCYRLVFVMCATSTKISSVCGLTGMFGSPFTCIQKDCMDKQTTVSCTQSKL